MYLEKFNYFIKKNKDYKLITIYNKIITKFDLNDLLITKIIPIINIHKTIQLLTQNQYKLTDEYSLLIIVYIILIKMKINIELTNKLRFKLNNEIPNFKLISKIYTQILNTLIIKCNIKYKKNTVISGIKDFLNFKDLIVFFNDMNTYIIENNITVETFL
jgi:hypothetical protein